jgi:environmental stress-induced protein Ves
MRKLDARSYRPMPWKNGGGTTTEIARSPEAGSLDDFDWRISMARVATSGPFSSFAGVDRSIAILEGGAIVLAIEGRAGVRLDASAAPFSFPADVGVLATLEGDALEDLNVMTRRGRYRHLLTRVRSDAPGELRGLGDVTVVVVTSGALEATHAATTEHLDRRDALVLERGAVLTLRPSQPAELLVVDLWRA